MRASTKPLQIRINKTINKIYEVSAVDGDDL